MKYVITNYTVIGRTVIPSDPMDYDEMLPIYNAMNKNARRGLADFPVVVDENGNEVII